MKKLLILTLVVASLGLLAETKIVLDDYEDEIEIDESGIYNVTGTGENDVVIKVYGGVEKVTCTLVLNNCTMKNFNCISVEEGNEANIQIVGNVNLHGTIESYSSSKVTVTGTGCLNLTNKGCFYIDKSGTLTIDGPYIACNMTKGSPNCLINDNSENGDNPKVYINNATIDMSEGVACVVFVENRNTADGFYFNGGSINKPNNVPFVYRRSGQTACDPVNENNSPVYIATLTDACTENSSYEYAATKTGSATPYTTYIGPGHSGSTALFLPLPNGTYTITGNTGKTYVGEINGGTPSPFTPAPEPCCGLLALLAGFGLLRRK